MSRSRIGIAIVVLATLLSSEAVARGFGLGPLGGVGFALTRLFAPLGLHRHRSFARHGHIRNAAVRPQDIRGATDSGRLLSDPAARAQIVAAAALAGWHGGRLANGWWRHGDGGYGWVGPLFWPFAYDDIYDYTFSGDGTGFWDYGYPDIYAAIFAPYGQDDLARYTATSLSGRGHRDVPPLQELCGDDSGENAGRLVDQIRQAVQPNETQRAALDDLSKASVSAAGIVRASCPTQTALTAPARLAAMQKRLEAMIKAELAVQPSLQKLYDLLNDEQKARLNALAEDRRKEAPARGCQAEPSAALQWPAEEIEASLHLDDTQRGALEVLQDASARAVEMLNYECQPKDAITPTARLDAVDRRLYAMQQAVNHVSVALEDFYATLSDEQKAQFEAIGPKRTA